LKLGEKLDTHIEKYILDHAYSDRKILCALIGMVIFCTAGFIGFHKKAYWGLLIGNIYSNIKKDKLLGLVGVILGALIGSRIRKKFDFAKLSV
jgi:uncharacterized membrane protein YfcA